MIRCRILGREYQPAIDAYYSALGLKGTDAAAASRANFLPGTGYGYQQDEAARLALAQASKLGIAQSGNTANALVQRAGDIAGSQWGDYLNRLQGFVSPQLQAIQGAATGRAGAYGTLGNLNLTGTNAIVGALGNQFTGGRGLASDISGLYTGLAGTETGVGGARAGVQTGYGQDVSNVLGNATSGQAQSARDVVQGNIAANNQIAQAGQQNAANIRGLLGAGVGAAGAAAGGYLERRWSSRIMAINPLQRPVNFDVPTFPASAAVAPASTWSNIVSGIGSLGQGLGAQRDAAEVADLMRSATDSSGNLDLNKAATAIALSGRDPIKYINALTARSAEQRGEAAQRALEKHYGATEGLMREQRDLERQKYEEGTIQAIEDPYGGPTRYIRIRPGEKPPEEIPIPKRTPGPQSALPEAPGGQQLAFAGPPPPIGTPVEPGGNIPLQPRGPGNPLAPQPSQLPLPFNPENTPPYRVAGPPMPPPTPPGAAAAVANPVPAATAREAGLKKFEAEAGPEAAAVFRDVLDYKRGLPADDKKKQG